MADTPDTGIDHEHGNEMSFLEHLEELRWRVIKALIGIILGMILCWVFIDWIMNDILLRPIVQINAALLPGQPPIKLQNLKPFGQLFLYMQVAIIGGSILSLPNILYQIWAFIAPGLLPRERGTVRAVVAFSTFCFLAGVAFAYFVMLPAALSFFSTFGTATIENNIAVNEYMNHQRDARCRRRLRAADGVVVPLQAWDPDPEVHADLQASRDRRHLFPFRDPHAGNRSCESDPSRDPAAPAL
jgi:sec-independent protein translocase protein TatC